MNNEGEKRMAWKRNALLIALLLGFCGVRVFAQLQSAPPFQPTEFGSSNYVVNGNFNTNLTGWNSGGTCVAYDGTQAAPGQIGSAKISACGSGEIDALNQTVTLTGTHRFFVLNFYLQTDSSFTGKVFPSFYNNTNGSTSIGCGEQFLTEQTANQPWTIQKCVYIVDTNLFAGDALNLRFYVSGETAGNAWISGVTMTDAWVPFINEVTWPVFPYQLWSDKTPAYWLCNGASTTNEEACGVADLDPPPGLTASSLTVNVATTSTCATPLAQSQTINTPSNTQWWSFSGSGLTNGTAYYECPSVKWSDSSVTTYPSLKFVPQVAGAESGYMNWFDSDLALVHNQKREVVFGTYDRPSGTNRCVTCLWATGASCVPNQATAEACYLLDIQGMGPSAPQATPAAATTQHLGPSAFADYAASKFNAIMQITPVSTIDPLTGNDQLTPYNSALASIGAANALIANNYWGTAEGQVFPTAIPPGPVSPSVTVSSTGGSISVAFVCYAISDYASAGGSYDQTPASTAVCNSTTMSGTTNSAQVTFPACSTPRVWGYFLYGAASASSTPPAFSSFYLQGTAFPYACGSTTTLTTLQATGSQPTSAVPASPTLTVNATGGTISGSFLFVAIGSATKVTYSGNGFGYYLPSFLSVAASAAISGSTNQAVVTMPACNGSNAMGYMVYAETNTVNTEPVLDLQSSESASVACGGSYTINSISTGNYNSNTVGDGTWNQYRPSWAGALNDTTMWGDTATTMHGQQGALAFYLADESDPFSMPGVFYQDQSLYASAPDVPDFNLLISPTGEWIWASMDDILSMDNYAYGNSSGAQGFWAGSASRSCQMFTGDYDALGLEANDCVVSIIDSGTYSAMAQAHGARPFWHVLQQYSIGGIKAYTYGELRRELFKSEVGCEDWGNIGCGSFMWVLVSVSGMEGQIYIADDFGAYTQSSIAFSEYTHDDPMWLTDVSDSDILAKEFEGIGANTVDSVSGRSITTGKIVTLVKTDTATATVCGATSAYDNTTVFPFGPVQFIAKQLSDGTLDILFNNLCLQSAYNVTFTLNPSMVPAGQTQAVVRSSIGPSVVAISSNTITINAPNTQGTATVAGNDMDVYEIRIVPVRGTVIH